VKPEFSVVIPVHNRRKLLARALASLCRQTFAYFEVIVVDDGSSEDIASVVARFPQLSIRLITTGGRGANFARNMGTDAAAADFVAYLDSDDAFLPMRLEIMAKAIAAGDADILATPLYVWRGKKHVQVRPGRGPMPGEEISEFYFVADQRMQSTSFVVRAASARAVRWDEGLQKAQDADFMIRLVRAGNRLQFIDQPLAVVYDEPEGRISNSNGEANMRQWLDRSAGILTPRARRGFELYVLAYEVSRRSRAEALGLVLSNAFCGAVPPRVVLKALYRNGVPEALFKKTAQLALRARPSSQNFGLVAYLEELEAEAERGLESA
jgi:glycosyltransferase involved in cell wall biosynthesis